LKTISLPGNIRFLFMMILIRKLYKNFLEREVWQLLFRTILSARLVRQTLAGSGIDPFLSPAISAANSLYLAPQSGWTISKPHLIAKAANPAVVLPRPWGHCVHQSLITYRLLNGYGIPAKICFGISLNNPVAEGHAWIRVVNPMDQALAGAPEPLDRFQVVYVSADPEETNSAVPQIEHNRVKGE